MKGIGVQHNISLIKILFNPLAEFYDHRIPRVKHVRRVDGGLQQARAGFLPKRKILFLN
jgi:hypothetical protein